MEELRHTLALGFLKGLGQSRALQCYQHYGSATAALTDRDPSEPRLKAALAFLPDALRRADRELEFCARNGIRILPIGSPDYPVRLLNTPDAPLALFYRGTTALDARRVVAVVGTRHITEYGKDLCRHLCADLRRLLPDVLIVSGLAYGVDIHAHREALACGLDTVAVLAHGLDRIYPSAHRDTAARMTRQGGLLTEYPTATNPDKGNFVRRNRIVAGLADATIVVESAAKGGALITAHLARDYNRDVFAFPGRTGDTYSVGCNNLIRNNIAALATCAEDITLAMQWTEPKEKKVAAIQRELFPDLTPDEQQVAKLLGEADTLTTAQLLDGIALPFNKLNALLFGLELKGVVKSMPGGRFRLLK